MTIRIKTAATTPKKIIKIGAKSDGNSHSTSWVKDPRLLMATARRLEREHAPRINENRGYQRLYYAKPFYSGSATLLTDSDANASFMYDRLRRHGANLSSEIIDAGIALLARRLQPKILPVGGDYETQEACDRLGRVVTGVSEAGNWLSELTEVARAGMINDIGFALFDVDPATSEIKCWKLDSNYVYWPLDGVRMPRTIIVVLPVPKAKLAAQFPQHADKIYKLATWRPRKVIGVDDLGGTKYDVDTVAMSIGWALAMGPNDPGRKVVSSGDDLILDDQPYELDIHQVAPFRWKPNATGFAGVPLTRSIAPYDLTNKRLLARTLAALDGAVPWLLAEEENDIQAVSDIDFQRVTFPRGSVPPQVIVPNPVSTQALDRMEANRASAFREAHINESAAQGQAPPGFKSAVAQFAWADSVQTVLLPQQEEWQSLWRHGAHIVVALMGKNQKARVRMGDLLEEVSLPDLPRDKYKITFGLVSGLALTVSGRLEQLQQIQAALPNKLDNEDILRHIGLPDTQQLADRLLAPRELAEWIVQRALKDGFTESPPRMLGKDGLAALYRIASQEYCGALKKPRNYYRRDHLEALRRVILICEWMQMNPTLPPPPPVEVMAEPLPQIPIGPSSVTPGTPVPAPPPPSGAPAPIPAPPPPI